jgi:hypothetical protein
MLLAHFPVRSGSQVATKAIMGWLACLARPDRSRKDNYHLKRIYERFREGRAIDPEELTAMALEYAPSRHPVTPEVVFDPLRPEGDDFVLRYASETSCDPLSVLAQMSEEFAEAFGALRRSGFLVGLLPRKESGQTPKDV